MHSKIYILISVLITACSAGETDTQAPRIGTLPVKAATTFSSSSAAGSRDNTAIILNEHYNQILQVKIEPFELESKYHIPEQVHVKTLFVGPQADYFLAVGDKHFAIVGKDGSAAVDPIQIFGAIKSAAFDGEGGRLVIEDNFNSIGLIKLSSKGQVQETWVGGPLLGLKNVIEAGTIIPNGKLVLSLSNGKVALVDFDKSIASRSWNYRTFDPGLEPDTESNKDGGGPALIRWLSPVGDSRHVIVRTKTQVALIDTVEQTLVKAVTPNSIIGHFDQAVGHVLSMEPGTNVYRIYWAEEGKLKDRIIKVGGNQPIDLDNVEYLSILNPKLDAVSLTYGPYGNFETVYRIRLSDSRLISANETPLKYQLDDYTEPQRKAGLAVSAQHLIYLHYNSLGKLERRSLGNNPEALIIKGFNLEEAQDRW
jgi:hypothetical protein